MVKVESERRCYHVYVHQQMACKERLPVFKAGLIFRAVNKPRFRACVLNNSIIFKSLNSSPGYELSRTQYLQYSATLNSIDLQLFYPAI